VSDNEGVAKVAELIKQIRFAMLTTADAQGRLVSRPMAVQEVEFDGDLWFFVDESSGAVGQIRDDAQVNVSFSSSDSWVSVAGAAQVVVDEAKARELWNPAVEAWFPDGPDAPGLRLIKVHADTAEYWDSPGARVTTLLSYAKAKVTGEPYERTENEIVDL
jgi:general stress protein 26